MYKCLKYQTHTFSLHFIQPSQALYSVLFKIGCRTNYGRVAEEIENKKFVLKGKGLDTGWSNDNQVTFPYLLTGLYALQY